MTSARERWTQRIMGSLGARPVGHAEHDGPQVPVQPPAPNRAPAPPPSDEDEFAGLFEWMEAKRAAQQEPGTRRRGVMVIDGVDYDLPEPEVPQSTEDAVTDRAANDRMVEWWRADKPHLTGTDPVPADEPKPGPDPQPAPPQEVVVPSPPPGGPVEKVAADGPKRTAVRKVGEQALGDRRMRIVLFNATAAGLGWTVGLVQIIAAAMPVAERAATGTFAFVLAAAGAWTAWKITGSEAVRTVFRDKTVWLRCIATAAAAEFGRRLAPVPTAYLNRYGQEWDLGPSKISLLVTAGGICGLLWWFIDRRIRPWPWPCRWLFRVPLASALLACIPYTSTPIT